MFTHSPSPVQAALLFLSVAAPQRAYAALYASPEAAASHVSRTTYDYVIVGGTSFEPTCETVNTHDRA